MLYTKKATKSLQGDGDQGQGLGSWAEALRKEKKERTLLRRVLESG